MVSIKNIIVVLSFIMIHIVSAEPFSEYKNGKEYFIESISSFNDPIIDGLSVDDIWEIGLEITDFVQREPNRFSQPTEKTFCKIKYSEDAIFIYARMYDSSPDSIGKRITRRDDWSNGFADQSDWFCIELDTQHDHKTGYGFAVNSSGIQHDYILFDDSETDDKYDAVWDSAVLVDDLGWSVEIKIPFNMMGVDHEDLLWGLNIHRNIYRKNELISWVVLPRGEKGQSSKFGHILGFDNIQSKNKLELHPYIIGGQSIYDYSLLSNPYTIPSSSSHVGGEFEDNIGLDLRYRASSTKTLDITLNPDFGQVEFDPEIINLSAYETYYPENRFFFKENTIIFDVPIELFYSRRVGGIDDTRQIQYQINSAIKLTSQDHDGISYGLLYANSSPYLHYKPTSVYESYNNYGKNYYVGRLEKSFFDENLSTGIMATSYEELNKKSNIISFDNIISLFQNKLFTDMQYVLSENNGISGSAKFVELGYSSSSPVFFGFEYEDYDENFDINEVGFLQRNNYINHKYYIGVQALNPFWISKFTSLEFFHFHNKNYQDIKLGNGFGVDFHTTFSNYNSLSVHYEKHHKAYSDLYLYDPYAKIFGPIFPIPESNSIDVAFQTNTKNDFSSLIQFKYKNSRLNDYEFLYEINQRMKIGSTMNLNFGFERFEGEKKYDFLLLDPELNVHGVKIKDHYIFANSKGWDERYTIRFDKYFNKYMSMQMFFEYYLHYTYFNQYTELVDGEEYPISTEYIEGTELSQGGDGGPHSHYIPLFTENGLSPSPIGESNAEIAKYLDPNYFVYFYPKYSSLSMNLSIKWQYAKNSNIYLIYRLSREVNGLADRSIKEFLAFNKKSGWNEMYTDQYIYIKVDHWFDF